MNFDFYQKYKDYSNTELLKIIKRPADYQPAAVAIATQILSKREVTTEETQFVDQYFRTLKVPPKLKKKKLIQ